MTDAEHPSGDSYEELPPDPFDAARVHRDADPVHKSERFWARIPGIGRLPLSHINFPYRHTSSKDGNDNSYSANPPHSEQPRGNNADGQ